MAPWLGKHWKRNGWKIESKKLRKKQDDLEESARASRKRIQALKRKKKQVLTRQVRKAQARLNTHERRRRTRRLILMGTLLEHQVSHSEEAQSRLRHDLDVFLKRDRDRELFELPPLGGLAPASSGPSPDLAPPAAELPPLRGWIPARLPDGDWGARHPAPEKLPADLEGATIEIKTRGSGSLIRSVVEVLHRDADSVLVRDSGGASSA